MRSLHQYTAASISGEEFDFSKLKGKKVMLVNVASECGYTSQYEQLEELYQNTSREFFEIVAFPSNQFGGQEPGSNEEIAKFCATKFQVTFPLMAKISVVGSEQHEIYQFLTKASINGTQDSTVKWNFQKFLVDEKGQVVESIPSGVLPIADEIVNWING